jgi:hypothetical protein
MFQEERLMLIQMVRIHQVIIFLDMAEKADVLSKQGH